MGQILKSDTEELIRRVKLGDKGARDEIICNNMGLIGSVVKRFLGRGYDRDDLFQIGAIGLIKSVDKFDLSYNVAFSTYAIPMIIGEIKRFIRDDGMIKVSRSMKELSNKARVVEELLTKQLDRKPTIGEIAENMGIDKEELTNAITAAASPDSLYANSNEEEGQGLIDRFRVEEDEAIDVVNKVVLKQILDKLTARERQIIVLRYFKEKTQSKIADMLGISQVQVSRIEKKVLLRLRDMLRQE